MHSTSVKQVSVGGLQVTPFASMTEAVQSIIQPDGSVTSGFGIAINPEKVMLARADDDLRDLINAATLRFADGTGVVRTMRKKGVENTRIPGCELWEALMREAAKQQLPVMIIGAKPEVNNACAEKLKAMGTPVAAAIDGYFEDESQLHDALLQHRPKLVSVAMGSPKQEKLIQRLRKVYPDAFYLGVGGTYDVFTGYGKRAPKLFCDLHLEWFYRLCAQPSRIGRQLALLSYLRLHLTHKL
ncbi:WecB/TagA/CpsF family glycosyltransferase [Pseudidiomarina insulisalsae]|uniref:Lipopolysaccharide N-acetylmannosaminouronosyltransferase n=1 Tax=Pseudidiomarina insulisalsae TaxID=575789 RepID=A0A432YNY4_9GAMM|nr:WecB/TagA/CpsF family glycosyltransferase [Pseudidiomarina insulisalsae]RUO62618.1 lipopolysaccharide N-acetylmannosaminouronosyltransferase [Pseudidiomarina insulisalsae]